MSETEILKFENLKTKSDDLENESRILISQNLAEISNDEFEKMRKSADEKIITLENLKAKFDMIIPTKKNFLEFQKEIAEIQTVIFDLKSEFVIRKTVDDIFDQAEIREYKGKDSKIVAATFFFIPEDLALLSNKDFLEFILPGFRGEEISVKISKTDVANLAKSGVAHVLAFGRGKEDFDFLEKLRGAAGTSFLVDSRFVGGVDLKAAGLVEPGGEKEKEEIMEEEINLKNFFKKLIGISYSEFSKIYKKNGEKIEKEIAKQFVENLISQTADLQITVDEDKNTFYDSDNIKYKIGQPMVTSSQIAIPVRFYENPGDTSMTQSFELIENYEEMGKNPFENIFENLKNKIEEHKIFKRNRS